MSVFPVIPVTPGHFTIVSGNISQSVPIDGRTKELNPWEIGRSTFPLVKQPDSRECLSTERGRWGKRLRMGVERGDIGEGFWTFGI